MPPPSRSLRCLERFAHVGAPLADWRRETGNGFAAIEPLLAPSDRLALRWSRPGRPSLRIVDHDDGRAVALCDEELTAPVELTRAERVLHHTDGRKLRTRLCQALGLHPSTEIVTPLPGLLRIGEWRPKPAHSIAASLAIASTHEHLAELIIDAGSTATKPTLLLTPTRAMWSARGDAVIARDKIVLVPLDDVIDERNGAWTRLPAWDAYVVSITKCERVTVSTPGAPDHDIQERVSRLKHMERCVLEALGEHGVVGPDARNQPAQEALSKWTGYSCNTTFKMALSTLRKAGFIDNGRHNGRRGGYFLTPTGKQAADFLAKS